MKKGDIVRINGVVVGLRKYPNIRCLYRRTEEDIRTGIVLGYSFIKTGKIKEQKYGNGYRLEIENYHRVIVVEPLESWKSYLTGGLMKNNRYLRPVKCLEKDLELLIEGNL